MKRPSGQTFIPLALLALVALIGGLVFHARAMEASHRATAESALRDYAALAAWQYSQRVDDLLGATAQMTLNHVQHPWLMRPVAGGTLPDVAKLVDFVDPMSCGFQPLARFSFRLDLPGGTMHVAGSAPDSSVRRAIAQRFAALAWEAPRRSATIRMFVDTVGGEPRAIAYGVVRGRDSLPRAVYGVETDPSSLVKYLERIPADKPLLPPSLLRGQPIDSFMMVEVRRADGGVLATIGARTESTLEAREQSNASSGQLVTRVVVRPQAASVLLIGGMPASRLDMLLLLLAGSVAVAGMALWQIHRSRELSRLRTRFVANVSHELRTPLAQISMFSETLLLGRERSREEGREFLSVIFREARRLSHLVESVLRFSRADTGAAPRALRLEPRDVAAEVNDAVRAFAPLADAAGVTLCTELDEDAVARVESGALRQVMVNLLDNAVKFGPSPTAPGGQTVRVTVRRSDTEVTVSVEDEGPGIPAAERARVFEPFMQGASGQERATTGAGIGLAVVADLVSAHGGRVWVDDAPRGRGARVSFALPALSGVDVPVTTADAPPAAADEEPELLTVR